MNIEPI